jgi:hypothetical protein
MRSLAPSKDVTAVGRHQFPRAERGKGKRRRRGAYATLPLPGNNEEDQGRCSLAIQITPGGMAQFPICRRSGQPRRRLVEFASSAIGQQICHRGRTLDVGEREASTMEAKTADIWWVTIWVTAEAIRVFCVALLVQIRPISARMMTMIRTRPRVPPG